MKYKIIAAAFVLCALGGGTVWFVTSHTEQVHPASWWKAHPQEMVALLESCEADVPRGARAANCENATTARIDNTIDEAKAVLKAMDDEGK